MIIIIGIIAGCLAQVSSQDLPSLPALTKVERHWFSMPTDPIGTVVTRVFRERTVGSGPVRYGLDTRGPPSPFKIDPITGIVTINDTLVDKENQSYLIGVTTFDGSSIPQRTEILATITDKSGSRLNVVSPPPFALPTFPNVQLLTYPRTTQRTTKATTVTFIEEITVPDIITTTITATTSGPPDKGDNEPHEDKMIEGDENKRNISKIPKEETQSGNDIPLMAIPFIVMSFVIVVVALVYFYIIPKIGAKKSKTEKDDMSKDSGGIVLQDSHALNMWDRPRAYSNRYECQRITTLGDNYHSQISEETSISKEDTHDEWEFPRHRIRIFNIVGEGAFGQVWRAQAIDIDGKKGEQTVAVKTLKENASEKEKSDLLQELIVMKNLGTHPNVVRLIGCCTEKEPTLVIMEFVGLGKLQQFLRDSRAERHYGNTHGGSQFLTARDLTHFAFQVARGMDFLISKGIIHRDLAARNVLITEERTCKVADFGLARDVAGADVYERKSDGRLPIRWMSPESLYDGIFSVKSDIWSFGVLLWEIVTLGSTPYPGLSAQDVMRKVRDGHRLEKPEHCRRELYNIMYYCWEADPTLRPDFKEVVKKLEDLLCSEMDYIELERFPDHSYYNVQHLDGEKL